MKKYVNILVALVCLLGLGVAAKANIRTEAIVTVPFEFVVGGKTLPAGTYTVSSLDDKHQGLVLRNHKDGTSVFVHPFEVESASADNPQVSFERVGEEHFLSRIQTSTDVYNIPVYRSDIVVAEARANGKTSASAGSGSN